MLRNKNGSIISMEQYNHFMNQIEELFKDENVIKEYNFNEKDIESISKFMFLFHVKAPEINNNFIRKAFEKSQNRVYRERRKDKDYKDKSTLDKLIIKQAKTRYKKVALGKIDQKTYTSKKILSTVFLQLNKEINWAFFNKFIKKYTPNSKRIMNLIRIRYHDFKNSIYAKEFKENHSKGFYKNKINHDNLFKFLSITDKIKPTKEDLHWLSELTDILIQAPSKIDNIDEEIEHILLKKEQQKDEKKVVLTQSELKNIINNLTNTMNKQGTISDTDINEQLIKNTKSMPKQLENIDLDSLYDELEENDMM